MDKRFLLFAALILVLQFVIVADNYLAWVAKGSILMLLLPLIFIYLTRQKPSEFGLNAKNWKHSLLYTSITIAAGLPFLLYFSSDPAFKSYYPLWQNQLDFATAELILIPSLLGLEFFFRGFLLKALQNHLNWKYAVLFQAVLYMLVHSGKPMPEVLLSFFAGLAFGYMAFRTRSITPSFASHYAISVIFDALTV